MNLKKFGVRMSAQLNSLRSESAVEILDMEMNIWIPSTASICWNI
jgi:hypothetical protein